MSKNIEFNLALTRIEVDNTNDISNRQLIYVMAYNLITSNLPKVALTFDKIHRRNVLFR